MYINVWPYINKKSVNKEFQQNMQNLNLVKYNNKKTVLL